MEQLSREDLRIAGPEGTIRCRLHRASPGNSGVVWVFGAGGGFEGPAGGLYERLARVLQAEGIVSLQVDYRRPAHLDPCVADALAGAAFLGTLGAERIVFVGHSFGGAVAIAAGAAFRRAVGVAALSSQTHGAGAVGRLSPKALLLIHGEADEILPAACSRQLFHAAREPKQLVLYPDCRHGLDNCREQLDRDLSGWLLQTFAVGRTVPSAV